MIMKPNSIVKPIKKSGNDLVVDHSHVSGQENTGYMASDFDTGGSYGGRKTVRTRKRAVKQSGDRLILVTEVFDSFQHCIINCQLSLSVGCIRCLTLFSELQFWHFLIVDQ